MTSKLIQKILVILDNNNGELQGTEQLALDLKAPKNWTIQCVRRLNDDGAITILPSTGGRGKKTIYRRNPNQPGLPRKLPRKK